MNKAKLVLQYFGQYKPTKLRLIPTWRWGLYRIQIDDHIVDFRFLDGCNPAYAVQLAINEIRESMSGACVPNPTILEPDDWLINTGLGAQEINCA
jgi:hypothetical protein